MFEFPNCQMFGVRGPDTPLELALTFPQVPRLGLGAILEPSQPFPPQSLSPSPLLPPAFVHHEDKDHSLLTAPVPGPHQPVQIQTVLLKEPHSPSKMEMNLVNPFLRTF